jgi:hypothetical protein
MIESFYLIQGKPFDLCPEGLKQKVKALFKHV